MLVRGDLSPGMQLAQVSHGIAEFARDHREEFTKWIDGSNYIAVLQVSDEDALLDHADELHYSEFKYSLVHEPDIGEHTAIVIAPGAYWSRLSSLPLAGKEVALTS